MGGIMFSSLFNFVSNPYDEINKIMQERRLFLAFLGFFTGSLSLVMAPALLRNDMPPVVFVVSFVGVLFLNICINFFFASAAHLFLELTTGRGRATGLFVLLGISEFAKTLFVAYALCALVVPMPDYFKPLIIVFVLLMQLFFILYMMQQAYGLNKKTTFVALLISFIPSVVCLFTVIFLFIGFCVWFIFA